MQGRRMFLHTGAALAVPLIGGVLAGRQRGIVEAACRECADDPVSAESLRQFKAAIRALVMGAKGEHARQAAAALRTMAANGQARNLDAEFRRAVAREVRTYGRDNVLMRPFDREQFAATARELGIAPAPELLANPTLTQRKEALDGLLAAGLTGHMIRAAQVFERAGAHLDTLGPVRRVQTKAEQIAICNDLKTFLFSAEAAMIFACLLGGPFACAYFSGVYLGLRTYYEFQSECSKWLG